MWSIQTIKLVLVSFTIPNMLLIDSLFKKKQCVTTSIDHDINRIF